MLFHVLAAIAEFTVISTLREGAEGPGAGLSCGAGEAGQPVIRRLAVVLFDRGVVVLLGVVRRNVWQPRCEPA
jgi:hypothetical protein